MGLYHSSQAKDSCGFGLIAQLDGKPAQRLIKTAITALIRMTHRGSVAIDGKTGDGCGISIQLSKPYFRELAKHLGFSLGHRFAIGQIFLNPDPIKAARCRQILEDELTKETISVSGWRKVPIDKDVCGKDALKTLPNIEQVFVTAPPGWQRYDLERRLFMARRRAAERVTDDDYYYVASLSSLMIVYKGLVIPKNLSTFYPELAHPKMKSAICLFHQRFSTNTLPLWKYAQPFRFLAHNGEINTISANRSWSVARKSKFFTPLLPDLPSLQQLVNQSGSDSSSLDNMLEVLLAGGMDIFRALRLLIPPAWANRSAMDPDLRAFYEFNSMHMEPWDGPAGIVMTNGEKIACNIDRNGLRPARYVITKDRVLTVASEIGVWDYKEENVIEKGRIGPGEMLAADVSSGKIWRSGKIDDMLKIRHPYLAWLRENTIRLRSNVDLEKKGAQYYIEENIEKLPIFSHLFGVSVEEKEQVIKVIANDAQEGTFSMGDDTPFAVLSQKSRSLYDYFRQQFAQVTNPPIDSLREKSVMSLETCFGREHNIFQETNGLSYRVIISAPVLNYAKLQQLKSLDQTYYQFQSLSINYSIDANLNTALTAVCDRAVELVKNGCVILQLTDRDINESTMPIHASLATGAVHQRLIKEGLRCDVNLIVETATVRDPHHFAVLIGVGATAIYPYLALQIINQLSLEGQLVDELITARKNYLKGINKGLLKILSKMGISTIGSYRGACLFEIVGLDHAVSELCFPAMPCRIGGATFKDLHNDVLVSVANAWGSDLPIERSGILKFVYGGEYHCYNPDVVTQLQLAVTTGLYSDYQKFADTVNQRPISTLRDLMRLKLADNSSKSEKIELDEIESKESLYKRFDSAGMSIGALSPEAHEALAVAMNRLGGRSNSGEGGEDPSRFNTEKNSRIKQVASGRFGVNAKYLVNADVLQIKIAQGAKPGEGGQLPGNKVTLEIAKLRNSVPGVTLISPPPHHDIYSIEDIAQLIFDLKQVNPSALISVKLVSGPGVGTIAAGVAKAHADLITVSGYDGGTAASPLTSVKYAGTPWEIGLSEVHQALIENGLRDRVCLQVDGGLKTGLDVIKGAILGADSFGFGTGPMVALGCKYLRICHLNNCATGIATQNKNLRENHYHGLPEKVMNYFSFVAEETQQWLQQLGIKSLNELIGRTDLLQLSQGTSDKQNHLQLQVILDAAKRPSNGACHYMGLRNPCFDKGVLNQQILKAFKNRLNVVEVFELEATIHNYDRSVGAALAGFLASEDVLDTTDNSVILKLNFLGIAGQSFGAWNYPGMQLRLEGDANDYVGKGMSGGRISIFSPENISYVPSRSTIIGNTCLYGASGGELYVAGQAGERFAVRNSGATAVVEGIGDHGCEYMTGGIVLILGPVGENFGAGMTGGIALVLDLDEHFSNQCNMEHIQVCSMVEVMSNRVLAASLNISRTTIVQLLEAQILHTSSRWSKKVLQNLDNYIDYFMLVIPKETLSRQTQALPVRLVNEK